MDAAFATAIAGFLVACVAGASAYASQRTAAKASTTNANTASRSDMEKDAYERARAFDVGTIERQDAEIEELRLENLGQAKQIRALTVENEDLRSQIRALVERIRKLEEKTNPKTNDTKENNG